MFPFTPMLMNLYGNHIPTFNPDRGASVFCVLALCALIIFWERERHWEHKDELPLRITAASTLLFIYSIWWQAAEHGWPWLYEVFTVVAAIGIITAIVMAFLNEDAKFRRLLLWTAAVPATLFLIFHEPQERPEGTKSLDPEMERIIQEANKRVQEQNEGER